MTLASEATATGITAEYDDTDDEFVSDTDFDSDDDAQLQGENADRRPQAKVVYMRSIDKQKTNISQVLDAAHILRKLLQSEEAYVERLHFLCRVSAFVSNAQSRTKQN